MRALGAFGLGLISFLLFMFFGETFGLLAAFVVLIVYFFLCQLLLSRGHAGAHKEDLGVMLALDATMIVCAILVICFERLSVVVSQVPVMLGASWVGTYLGAAVASRTARRGVARQ
jgi:hypothetical protein